MSEDKLQKSINLMQRGKQVIPGGVNSPVRAFNAVGGHPIFFQKGAGPYTFDVDGNKYVDYVGSWGPLILGHAHPEIVATLQKAITHGSSFGAPCEQEVEIAELITQIMPAIEMVRMVNSGTEATMSAIRLARAYTKRQKIVKFDSCYHGHSDSLLVKAGSGLLTLGIAGSAGVIPEVAEQTLIAPYNDLLSIEAIFAEYGDDIAAIIVEPIAANNNLILPKPGFLQGLRNLCDKHNSILIFDEVITGFRVALGGAQELYSITPDLTCLGKIIGGGLPVGAFGGRRDIMQLLAPLGPVYQAGTLSGNPLAMHAGLATLKLLQKNPQIYPQLQTMGKDLMNTFVQCANDNEIELAVVDVCGLFGFRFCNDNDNQMFKQFFHMMLNQGIYLAPSAFEAGFVSSAHNQETLDATKNAAAICFAELSMAYC